MDMIRTSNEQFHREPGVDASKTALLAEITLDNLRADGELDEKDFLDRSELLCVLGQTVLVSNCEKHQKLIDYFSDYKFQSLGIVIGARQMLEFMSGKYYRNMDGRLLAAFGEVFTRNVRLYVYPALQEGSEDLMTAQNLPVPEGVKFLYRHLLDNRQVIAIENFNPAVLHIFSREVLQQIRQGDSGWEELVPKKVAELVKEQFLFGYPCEKLEFEY
jgi:hypothetical protein